MNKANLLIVDDEELIVSNLKFILKKFAAEIYTASNGLEALDVLTANDIHCIISDIRMPKMNGVEFLKEVRSRGMNIPFIVYTGHGDHELMLEVGQFGVFDFLDKPNLDRLEEVVAGGLTRGFSPPEESLSESEYHRLLKDLK